MKKLFFVFLSLVLIVTISHPGYAANQSVSFGEQVEFNYFDDGSYTITVISDENTDISLLSTTTTTKSKVSTHYSNSNEALWYVKVTGTFTYGDGSAKCISSSVNAEAYNSNWKVSDRYASLSGASATAKATGKLYQGGRVVQTILDTVTLTCDANGNFY